MDSGDKVVKQSLFEMNTGLSLGWGPQSPLPPGRLSCVLYIDIPHESLNIETSYTD